MSTAGCRPSPRSTCRTTAGSASGSRASPSWPRRSPTAPTTPSTSRPLVQPGSPPRSWRGSRTCRSSPAITRSWPPTRGFAQAIRALEAAMRAAFSLFYSGCELVLSPSAAADESINSVGIPAARIRRWERGVDLELYSADKANRNAYPGQVQGPLRGTPLQGEGRRPPGRRVRDRARARPASPPAARRRRARGGRAQKAPWRLGHLPRLARPRGAGAGVRELRPLRLLLDDRHLRPGDHRGAGERPPRRRRRRRRAADPDPKRGHRLARGSRAAAAWRLASPSSPPRRILREHLRRNALRRVRGRSWDAAFGQLAASYDEVLRRPELADAGTDLDPVPRAPAPILRAA